MKLFSLLVGFLLASQISFAQVGSVVLLNGTGTQLSTHASISDAYTAISSPISQAYTIELQNTYLGTSETVPLVLGAKSGASAANTITIRPAANFGSIVLMAPVSMGNLLELNNADYIILDGRPGGIGTTRAISLNNSAANGNTIGLINGASNNTIRYLDLSNGGAVSSSSNIALLTSPANPEGNSNNRIEYNVSIGSISGFSSNGTPANPNRNNLIYGNEIQSAISSAIWMQLGTGNVTIDSNLIYSTNVPSTVNNHGILFDSQTDTAIIRNNYIYDVYTSNNAATFGIYIRSTSNLGNMNYSEIYNNFISLNPTTFNSTSIVGIAYGSVYPVNAKIMFNTVSIGGTLNMGGITESVLSAAFAKTASNVSNSFLIKNNLFLNSRTGGVAGGQHVAISLANTNGTFNCDYNTYNSAQLLTRFGTGIHNTVASFALAMGGGNETNSNATIVQLVGNNNLNLAGSSLGNPNLGGTQLAGITRDRFNNNRSNVPYRGAHEASPSLGGSQCQLAPSAGNLVASDTVLCAGQTMLLLRLQQATTGGGIVYEWQESTDNVNFTAITLATNDTLLVNPTATRWYRVIVRCVPAALQSTTNTLRIVRLGLPTVGSLNFSRQGATYSFVLTNSTNVSSYVWNFGDGSAELTTSVPNASHTYTQGGPTAVRIKVSNNCGIDSSQLNLTINVSVAENELPQLQIYPNPFTDVVQIDGMETPYTVQIKDLQGRILLQHKMAAGSGQLQLDELKAAIYLLEVTDEAGRQNTKRLVKL